MKTYDIPGVKIFEYTKIIGLENIVFGKHIIIDDFVLLYIRGKAKIGNYVHIASFSSVSGGGDFIMEDSSGLHLEEQTRYPGQAQSIPGSPAA